MSGGWPGIGRKRPGAPEQRARWGLLDDPACVHDGYLVGSTSGDAEVGCDEDRGHVSVTLQLAEQIEDLGSGAGHV
jgi:hypothetical protein